MVSEGRFSSIPRLRALVSLDGTVPSSFLQAVEELSRGFLNMGNNVTILEQQINNLGRIPGLENLRDQLQEIADLESGFREALRHADVQDRARGTGTRYRDLATAGFLTTRTELVENLNEEIRRTREIVRDSVYGERIRTRVVKDRRREEERITREVERQNEIDRRSRVSVLSRAQVGFGRRAAEAAGTGDVNAANQLLNIQRRISATISRTAMLDRERERSGENIRRTANDTARATARHAEEQRKIAERAANIASDRRYNNLLRSQDVLTRRIAETIANRQTAAYKQLNQQLQYVNGRLRSVARTEQQREQVNGRIFKSQQDINRATRQTQLESQRVGREIRSWRDFSQQFLENLISAANRIPHLRGQLVRTSVFLGALGAAAFGINLAFRGAFRRARYTQRAVLRGGLIDRDFTQSLSRAIRLRGSTPEDATEFVAQTPSGFRSDVGDPVERANIQARIARLGVTQDEFDIGRIANLPDRDLFKEIFRLAQTVFERSGNPASVATLGKILGIDEQEARTLTHLVQARGGIEGLIEDIEEYRPVAEETSLSNLYLGTSFEEMATEAGHVSDVFVSTLAPALTLVIRWISEAIIGIRSFLERNRAVAIIINSLLIGALTVAAVKFVVLAKAILTAAFNITILAAAKTALTGGLPGFIAGLGKLAIGIGAVAAAAAAAAQVVAQSDNVLRDEIDTINASTDAINANNDARSDQFNILRLLERKQIFGLTEQERLARFAGNLAVPSPAPPVPPPGIRSVGLDYNPANFNKPIVVNVEGNLDSEVLPSMEEALRRAVTEGGIHRYRY